MNGSATINNHLESWRIRLFLIIIGSVFGIFMVRLFTLQVVEYPEWVNKALENSTDQSNLAALRGIIYDRNGTILARNVPSYNVVITAANLPEDDGAIQQIFRELAELTSVPVNGGELSQDNPYVPCISDHGIAEIAEYADTAQPYDPIKIECDINERTARIIQEKAVDWPGISIEIQPIREYPTGSLTAGIVGFLGPIPAAQEAEYIAQGFVPNRDKVGYAGIELQHQDILAGKNGRRVSEIDVAGQVVRQDIEEPVPVEPGKSLRLTIDTRLQQAAEVIFTDVIQDWNNRIGEVVYSSGVVIAMNPTTGEILSMVSLPAYDNERMSRIIPAYYYEQLIADPTNPLLNHAVGDVLPAGSVFKLVTSVGALNEKVVTPEQVIDTPPVLEVEEKFYANQVGQTRRLVDWNEAGFGQQDFIHGLANSSNVYFYKLGGGFKEEIPNGGLGICRLGTYARAMGYGDAPDIGLPDEQKGLVPDPTWKRINQSESWSSGDTYIASVGQGYVLATPIQVLLSAATVAANGKLVQPTLIKEVLDNEGNVIPMWKDADGNLVEEPGDGNIQVSPFTPHVKWDLTLDPMIQEYSATTIRGCEPIPGQLKTVEPWIFDKVREGMRLAVTQGTLAGVFEGSTIAAAGKTGTAEYCDKYADAKNRCIPGQWPTHAWTVGFAPYENPEIAVVAFVYNGGEGASVAGPIVRRVMEAYFELAKIDAAAQQP
jgi:penicillin-binding protein 2